MIGCGWVWLIKTDTSSASCDSDLKSKFKVITTFNGATPLFKSDSAINSHNSNLSKFTQSSSNSNSQISTVKNSPILGLNLWESAFILDYGLDRDAYVNNWWKVINWNVASVLLSK